MSIYQVQKCLFDYLRAREHAPKDQRPDIATIAAQGYELTDEERKAVQSAAQLVPANLDTVDGVALTAALEELPAALAPVAERVEALRVHLVGHSHIDMNWLWTWPDTVEVIKRGAAAAEIRWANGGTAGVRFLN